MKKLFVALGLAALVSAALWLPSVAQSEDVITASVTVQNVSVTVNLSTVDYGTLSFEATQRSGTAPSPFFIATNNGNVNEDLNVRGADATFTGGSWTIQATAPTCPTQTDLFRHSVIGATSGTDDGEIFMTTLDSGTPLATGLAANGTKGFNSKIYLPCSGSGGLGETASTTITVVATAS